MIFGEFNDKGELFFDIDLISADGDIITVPALLDTGFTGWLCMNTQDADSLGWIKEISPAELYTARGISKFDVYEGNISLDGENFNVEVLGSDDIENILLGVFWLRTKKLVVDFPAGVLTLG